MPDDGKLDAAISSILPRRPQLVLNMAMVLSSSLTHSITISLTASVALTTLAH